MAHSSNRNSKASQLVSIPIRATLLAACLGWFFQKYLKAAFLPHGPVPPMPREDRPTYASVDTTKDQLDSKYGKLTKIYERVKERDEPLLKGAETVFFDAEGTMYTATDDGNIISLTDFQEEEEAGRTTAQANLLAHVPGRALGAQFDTDGTLYMADAALGLTRLRDISSASSKLEILATHVEDDKGQRSRIQFADDLMIGPKTGKIYFTDASAIPPNREYHHKTKSMTYDVMYASKVDSMYGPSGRLLEYDPHTGQVAILAENLWFANGISVDPDETYLIFDESFSLRIGKYYLEDTEDHQKGSIDYIVNGDPTPTYFDGLDCRRKGDPLQGSTTVEDSKSSYCYVGCPSAVVPAHKLLWMLPHPFDVSLRNMLLLLPKWIAPDVKPYGGIAIIDPERMEYVDVIQDASGQNIRSITGVTLHDDKLYLGSLVNKYIGVYDLN